MQHIAQKPGGLVIEIVARGHHIVVLFDCHAIELVAFDGSTRRTCGAMDELGQFLDSSPGFLFNGMEMQRGSMRGSDRFGELRHLGVRLLRVGPDPEIHIERVGTIAKLEQNVPECQAVFSAGHRHENPVLLPEHPLGLDRSRDLIVDEAIEAAFAEGGIMAREADDSFRFTFGAIHSWLMRRETQNVGNPRRSPAGFQSDRRRTASRLR